jgi:hypothetical protein
VEVEAAAVAVAVVVAAVVAAAAAADVTVHDAGRRSAVAGRRRWPRAAVRSSTSGPRRAVPSAPLPRTGRAARSPAPSPSKAEDQRGGVARAARAAADC